ncbi:MAG: redoxin domain-containing protein [Acidobacteria bacterium]|nr:MAG: redoxin domain-containing protein [Acidobacteriota bacterium]TDI48243.1 MAG: redoxin domain-containing protein [Acidobacteriota bacterium]
MASQEEETETSRAGGARDFLSRQGEMLEAGFSFSGFERDMVALNRGDGTFLNISGVSGADSVSDGRGAVYVDLDNDGDLDIFLRAMHGPAHFLYENRIGQDAGFLRVTLEGRQSGRDAFGAVVRVGTASGRLTALKSGGSGFLSQSDPRLLFGLGKDPGVDWIEVQWPSGLQQRFPGAAAGSSLLLVEGEDEARKLTERSLSLPVVRGAEDRLEAQLTFSRGESLPDIPVQTLAGESVSLREILPAGQRTLVNLWATWCTPCAREMPELERLYREGDGNLAVIGLSLDRPGDRERIQAFLTRMGTTYPVYVTTPDTWDKIFRGGRISVPLSILVNEDGRVEALFGGWSRKTHRRLRALAGE